MTKATVRQLTAPVFLLLCLVLGGSSQSIWGALVLQLVAIAILVWALILPGKRLNSSEKGLLLLVLAVFVLVAIQLVPLPPALWTGLPGRDVVAEGYGTLGQSLPWQPISLTPYSTLGTFLFLLVPLAMIVAVIRLNAYRPSWLAAALFVGTAASILLGYVQLITGGFGNSTWYLYENTNVGAAVGFFANRNHMGTLLLMTFPFVVSVSFESDGGDPRRATSRKILGGAGIGAILLGLAANGSLAAVALAVPVMAASAVLVPSLRRFRTLLLAGAGVALLGALIVLASSPVQPKLTGENTSSFESRWEIWTQTASMIRDSFPVGTGAGSFEPVYATGEPPQSVARVYVNHAHNDYLEILLETGVAGLLLLALFFVWWLRQAARIFADGAQNRFAAAATIASAATLAHSAVDYPLRTAAIAATFAFCLATMATSCSSRPDESTGADRPRARHLKIG